MNKLKHACCLFMNTQTTFSQSNYQKQAYFKNIIKTANEINIVDEYKIY